MEDNTLLGMLPCSAKATGVERLSFEMRGKHILENGKGWEAANLKVITFRGIPVCMCACECVCMHTCVCYLCFC